MASNIDPSVPIQGNPTTLSVRENFQASKDEIEALQAKDDAQDVTITANTAAIDALEAQIPVGTEGQLQRYDDGVGWVATSALTVSDAGLVSGLWNNFGTPNAAATLQVLTQAQYDGLTPDANTLYYIVN